MGLLCRRLSRCEHIFYQKGSQKEQNQLGRLLGQFPLKVLERRRFASCRQSRHNHQANPINSNLC